MKKKFIGIIGRGESGKSTIIRSLTGCRTLNFSGEVLANTNSGETKSVYVIAHSPQETGLDEDELATIIREVIDNSNCLGIVIAIQQRHTRTRLSIADIFRLAKDTNMFDCYAAIINPSFNEAINDVNQIQNLLGDQVQTLIVDGRRFAIISAEDIRQVTGLL